MEYGYDMVWMLRVESPGPNRLDILRITRTRIKLNKRLFIWPIMIIILNFELLTGKEVIESSLVFLQHCTTDTVLYTFSLCQRYTLLDLSTSFTLCTQSSILCPESYALLTCWVDKSLVVKLNQLRKKEFSWMWMVREIFSKSPDWNWRRQMER